MLKEYRGGQTEFSVCPLRFYNSLCLPVLPYNPPDNIEFMPTGYFKLHGKQNYISPYSEQNLYKNKNNLYKNRPRHADVFPRIRRPIHNHSTSRQVHS